MRAAIDRVLNAIATAWIAGNSGWMRLTQRTQWDVAGIDGLDYRGWYMVNCNHQSWVDILVLQHLLNRRIPLLKFFLKQQLIYVPVIGLAWWALDFPFMRRHSDAYLKAAPGEALRRPRDDAQGLREVRAGADQRDELRRGHALHAGQAPRAALAVPPPAEAQGRRAGAGARRAGRPVSIRCST